MNDPKSTIEEIKDLKELKTVENQTEDQNVADDDDDQGIRGAIPQGLDFNRFTRFGC